MTAEQAVRAAFGAALRAGLGGRVNAVLEGAGGRTTAPWATIGDVLAIDWGTKTAAGRELRVTVTIRDSAETPARLEGLMALAEDAIAGMPRALEGRRVASLAFVRSRIGREGGGAGTGGWIGLVEHRVRVLAE